MSSTVYAIRWVARRTSVINQIRGLLLERGITKCWGLSRSQGQISCQLAVGSIPLFLTLVPGQALVCRQT